MVTFLLQRQRKQWARRRVGRTSWQHVLRPRPLHFLPSHLTRHTFRFAITTPANGAEVVAADLDHDSAERTCELIRALRPDVFVKGGDYTRERLPEAPLVEELGGVVHILPYLQDRSTTGIIQKIQATGGKVGAGA